MGVKFCILVIFIILSTSTYASWQTYQNDLENSGKVLDIGYAPKPYLKLNTTFGMNYQPLVYDIDLDGRNEIILFHNQSMFVLDKLLNMINSTYVGRLEGQPTIFNGNIIFNANDSGINKFLVYEFSDGLKKKFEILLPNSVRGAGIKCLELDEENLCAFRDQRNFINIVNLEARTLDRYNTTGAVQLKGIVPAIGDIDGDGHLEAIFWNDQRYGLMVFDLVDRRLDPVFNGNGMVDLLFAPYDTNFILKQPVLVDLNNDGRLEIIVSVVYQKENTQFFSDTFTKVFVYDYTGRQLFWHCASPGLSCDDSLSTTSRWYGSNPFVMDYNGDGLDDACVVMETTGDYGISCYNYSGQISYKRLFYNNPFASAITADFNNDGDFDFITTNGVFLKNSTRILSFNIPSSNIIASDIDGNGGLDLLSSYDLGTIVFLDNSSYGEDISVSKISFSKYDGNLVNVSATVYNNGQRQSNGVKIQFYSFDSHESQNISVNLRINSNYTFSTLMSLEKYDTVRVFVDPDNLINEADEKNNFESNQFMDFPYVIVRSDTGIFGVDYEFEEFVKNHLTSAYTTDKISDADVEIYIGKENNFNLQINHHLEDMGFDKAGVFYYNYRAINPYSGIVASIYYDVGLVNSKRKVMIVGNDIEGDIAAAKEFVNNQDLFLSSDYSTFIGDENIDAIRVYDFMHNSANEPNFKSPNDAFRKIVRNSLNDWMFDSFDHSVNTPENINLRLRNLKPGFSQSYLDYLSEEGVPVEIPVVLAHGIFSNLSTWETLGSEVANTGRDTWLIEITGGPGQDCDTCVDYTFNDLTDSYVPTLLNEVLGQTEKDDIQYVGFSNGCRAALDSLEKGMFDPDKIETFVAVGCPGAFEGNSTAGMIIQSKNGMISKNFNLKNKSHLSFGDLAFFIFLNKDHISKDSSNKISNNLFNFYEEKINLAGDTQPGDVHLNEFVIIQGNALNTDDGLVTVIDESKIYEMVQSNSKKRFNIFSTHSSLDSKSGTKSIIIKTLNDKPFNFYEKTVNLLNETL